MGTSLFCKPSMISAKVLTVSLQSQIVDKNDKGYADIDSFDLF